MKTGVITQPENKVARVESMLNKIGEIITSVTGFSDYTVRLPMKYLCMQKQRVWHFISFGGR